MFLNRVVSKGIELARSAWSEIYQWLLGQPKEYLAVAAAFFFLLSLVQAIIWRARNRARRRQRQGLQLLRNKAADAEEQRLLYVGKYAAQVDIVDDMRRQRERLLQENSAMRARLQSELPETDWDNFYDEFLDN